MAITLLAVLETVRQYDPGSNGFEFPLEAAEQYIKENGVEGYTKFVVEKVKAGIGLGLGVTFLPDALEDIFGGLQTETDQDQASDVPQERQSSVSEAFGAPYSDQSTPSVVDQDEQDFNEDLREEQELAEEAAKELEYISQLVNEGVRDAVPFENMPAEVRETFERQDIEKLLRSQGQIIRNSILARIRESF